MCKSTAYSPNSQKNIDFLFVIPHFKPLIFNFYLLFVIFFVSLHFENKLTKKCKDYFY